MALADGKTQAGIRVHVDVVVYRKDPALYGRMIVLVREAKSETCTLVTCEVDAPSWRFNGIARADMGPYDVRMEIFDALELWTEEECGAGRPVPAAG